MAAAITGGSATVTGVVPEHLDRGAGNASTPRVRRSTWATTGSSIAADGGRRAVDIVAEPYPGIPTDCRPSGRRWRRWPTARAGRRPRVSRPFPARGRAESPGGANRVRDGDGHDHGRRSPERGDGDGLAISGPAPPWSWPAWPPRAAPSSTTSTISTAATSGSTRSCGNSGPGSNAARSAVIHARAVDLTQVHVADRAPPKGRQTRPQGFRPEASDCRPFGTSHCRLPALLRKQWHCGAAW